VLETIHRQASLLINMVNELLDLARIEARQGKDMKREPCRLGDLVEQAVAGSLMVHRRRRAACALDCRARRLSLLSTPRRSCAR
jgi:signal transduction histidine kinase